MRAAIGASLVLAAVVTLAACGTATATGGTGRTGAPSSGGPTSASAVPSPSAGSRTEAAVLAQQMLSRLRLPAGARRLPPDPLPPALSDPATWLAGGAVSLDQHQLFALTQPMATAAAFLAAHGPASAPAESARVPARSRWSAT